MKELVSCIAFVIIVFQVSLFVNNLNMIHEQQACGDAVIKLAESQAYNQMRPKDFKEEAKLDAQAKSKCKIMEIHAKTIEQVVK